MTSKEPKGTYDYPGYHDKELLQFERTVARSSAFQQAGLPHPIGLVALWIGRAFVCSRHLWFQKGYATGGQRHDVDLFATLPF